MRPDIQRSGVLINYPACAVSFSFPTATAAFLCIIFRISGLSLSTPSPANSSSSPSPPPSLVRLKQGKLFWFKDSHVTPSSTLLCVIPVSTCLIFKSADDVLHKPCVFELSTTTTHNSMYLITDIKKEKEEWINSIRHSLVQHSRSLTDSKVVDYDNRR